MQSGRRTKGGPPRRGSIYVWQVLQFVHNTQVAINGKFPVLYDRCSLCVVLRGATHDRFPVLHDRRSLCVVLRGATHEGSLYCMIGAVCV